MGPQNFCIAPENEPSGTPNVLTLRLLSWYHLGTLGSPARQDGCGVAAQRAGPLVPETSWRRGQDWRYDTLFPLIPLDLLPCSRAGRPCIEIRPTPFRSVLDIADSYKK
jgi:hypothetical protein